MSEAKPPRVLGIGGIFFKARDPAALAGWYQKHLDLPVDPAWGGCIFPLTPAAGSTQPAHQVWSPFPEDTDYYAPSEKPFMINYRVADLDAVMAALQAEGVELSAKTERSEYGAFGWVMDPEGNKIELWQPPEQA